MSQLQVTGEAKIRDIQGPVVANSGVITALDGAASQYVRGDGTLADFPTSSGGGSSVSYYLNSSVSQGTIGGVAYRELNKEPIIGTGTDIAISSNGYVANYLTDANDPDVVLVPGGNFNCEFYFSVSNDTGNPFTYAELYKYDGTTFTLLGTSVGVPEYINQGTIIAPYYFAIPVPSSALALTDRLAIRIYVNVDGRTVTLHTENSHLCQVVTTLSKGMVSLNNLTDQSQYLTTGTSGTDFNIVSSGDTHTFNIPSASATNRGLITTGSQTITGVKTFNANVKILNSLLLNNSPAILGVTDYGALSYAKLSTESRLYITDENDFSSILSFTNTADYTYTFPAASGTLALTDDLSDYVPYIGATASVNLGVYDLIASGIYGTFIEASVNGLASSPLVLRTGTTGFSSGTDAVSLISSPTSAHTLSIISNIASPNVTKRANIGLDLLSATRTFTLPDISGTLALLEGNQTFSGSKIFSNSAKFTSLVFVDRQVNINKTPTLVAYTGGYITNYGTSNGIVYADGDTSNLTTFIYNFGGNYDYTFPASSGTIALTSDLGAYVTLATTQTISGNKTFTGNFIASNYAEFSLGGLVYFRGSQLFNTGISFSDTGSPSIFADAQAFYVNRSGTTSTIVVRRDNVSGSSYAQTLSFSNNAANRTYTFPDATGTIALTSNLSAYLPLSGGTLTGPLGGTSATFSGRTNSSTLYVNSTEYTFANFTSAVIGPRPAADGISALWFRPSDASNNVGTALASTSSAFTIGSLVAGPYLSIALSTGAATFSSSVTASQGIFPNATTPANTTYIGQSNTGAYLGTAASGKPLYFETEGAERMRITSVGNVGIGTSNINNSASGRTVLDINGTNTSWINQSVGGTAISYLGANSTNAFWNTDGAYYLVLGTNNTERMRIASGGDIGMGAASITNIRLYVQGATNNSSTQAINVSNSTGTNLFYARNDGYLYSVGAWSGSDIRLKENITDLDNGLQKVLGLKAKKFDLIDGLKNNFGFIAQEMQEVIPNAVSVFEEKEQLLAVRMDFIIPHLVKAIQEQQAQIEEKNNKIIELEQKVNQLWRNHYGGE